MSLSGVKEITIFPNVKKGNYRKNISQNTAMAYSKFISTKHQIQWVNTSFSVRRLCQTQTRIRLILICRSKVNLKLLNFLQTGAYTVTGKLKMIRMFGVSLFCL